MVVKRNGAIIETPMEARQAEPGPSILVLLFVSVSIAVLAMAAVWFVFFRTLSTLPSHRSRATLRHSPECSYSLQNDGLLA
jgi:hypothetical protein